MEYLAELFFVHSDFSLAQVLTNDFSQNHKNVYYIYIHANSILCYSVLIVKNQIELTTPYLNNKV